MSIAIAVHGYKHRLTNSGLLQSSPIDSEDWKERGMEEMNLPQVARNEFRNIITNLVDHYPENFVTMKKSQTEQPKFNASEPR